MKVKFLPSEEEHEIEFNETVLHLAQRKGIHIQSVCKGIPSCAECRVRIVDGEHHVLPPSKKEVDLIGTAHYIDLSRLSCQLRCFGNLTVDLTEQLEKEKRAQDKPKDRRARSDGKESQAVLGAIMDDFNADQFQEQEKPSENSEGKKDHRQQHKRRESQKEAKLDKRDDFYGSFYNEKNKKKTKSGGNSRNKKRNSRNRNRHRKNNSGKKPSANK